MPRSLKSQAGRRHPANVKAGQTRAALHALKALFLHPNPNRPNPSFPISSFFSFCDFTLGPPPCSAASEPKPNPTSTTDGTVGRQGQRERERV
ncbi:hypothetical protein AOLI_G00263930 [Acnodon oligacanthus]